jgi:mono/diheme cytochrome c family protein
MNLKVLGAAVAALAVGGVLAIVAAPKPAAALPAYAASTGKACGACHTNPAGGGARTAFGEAFAANGHKLPGKK